MRIPLSEAVERYKREPGAYSNAYEWYRRSAQRGNEISIHGHAIPAVKVGSRWTVDEAELNTALIAMRDERALRAQRSTDYGQRVLHPGLVTIEGGGYQVKGAFHFLWNDAARAQHRSDGCWICNGCWTAATEEHGADECHRCRDWGGCGRNCTLSRIYCSACGAGQSV
jgi:hypothetical protein